MTDGLTPSQTVGPYLTIGLIGGLVGPDVVEPSSPGAIRVHGYLLDGAGAPVSDGLIEIWQADVDGAYPARGEPAVNGFRGFGRCGTGADGGFSFVTVKPGRVPWSSGGEQAPHLAVGVFARGLLKRLATRMYFPHETEANRADPILSGLPPAARATLVAMTDDEGIRFDIRLQGDGHTTFFAV